ncbi:putative metal-dependent hydrolase [Winogradskyella eckloniae]|uniref:YfiT family bacillithiol transferase n=1 Tax=Winogradskyella eckloniae TaxID=1089306 RepID=UPI00156495AD|nr:putative metal-dependent hydrolase [Winogradskyella eckloniae]NRD21079.1 putative metal-dependent hydrolase [Winogradskyella eckloniae]
MTEKELYTLKYPIGEFITPKVITKKDIENWINTIESLPQSIIALTKNLNEVELKYKYRPQGWTIQQVVHHCADSHINSLLRFKLTLTEDSPIIKPYLEDKFAHLIDYNEPIDSSISILIGVHKKLGVLLKSLTEQQLKLEFVHPEHGKRFSLEETIGIYAWHSNHHVSHIKQALKFKSLY